MRCPPILSCVRNILCWETFQIIPRFLRTSQSVCNLGKKLRKIAIFNLKHSLSIFISAEEIANYSWNIWYLSMLIFYANICFKLCGYWFTDPINFLVYFSYKFQAHWASPFDMIDPVQLFTVASVVQMNKFIGRLPVFCIFNHHHHTAQANQSLYGNANKFIQLVLVSTNIRLRVSIVLILFYI